MNRSPEQLHALVRYRMEQAVETLREANLLLDKSAWRGAQNRAYYAMFYAVLVAGAKHFVQAIEEFLEASEHGAQK